MYSKNAKVTRSNIAGKTFAGIFCLIAAPLLVYYVNEADSHAYFYGQGPPTLKNT